jgi:hypothetical protein
MCASLHARLSVFFRHLQEIFVSKCNDEFRVLYKEEPLSSYRVCGAWCMVRGAWYLVRGTSRTQGKGKCKIYHRIVHEGPKGEYSYSPTLSLTSALGGVGGQHPAALPPEKTRYPLYSGLGGTQGLFGRVRKISPPPGFELQTIQAIASRRTD